MTLRRRCSASPRVLERQRAAQARDLQRAGEVAVALVARLQEIEQRGRDLMAALPAQRAEGVGVDEAAGRGVEHERLGQALMGDEVAALARDDPDRQAGAAAELGEHDRDAAARGRGRARARGRSAARRRGGPRASRTRRPRPARAAAPPGRARLRPARRRSARTARVRRDRRRGRRAPTPATARARPGGGQVTDACSRNGTAVTGLRTAVCSVAAAHVPTSAELCVVVPSGVPDGNAS